MTLDAKLGEPRGAAEFGRSMTKDAPTTSDFIAQQLDRGFRRAAGGDQVVNRKHRIAGADRVLVDLDHVDAVFELVILADCLPPGACPSCGSARSRSVSGRPPRRRE